jgi:dihydrofolate reductase
LSRAGPLVSLVAAFDRKRAIGRDNQLPWRLADDLKRFKALTLGKPVLMGRKTAQALGRALPGRRNLVLTRSGRVPFADMEAVDSLQRAIESVGGEQLMVIGGGEIYALALPIAVTMHLTHVDTEVAGADAFFPDFDPSDWELVRQGAHAPDDRNQHAFEFMDYRRR